MVEEHKYSIYRAAKDLNIKQSTAKAIMRRFRSKGTVFVKK
jgi:Mn-dependent DtxR family transcriptional regulator